MRRKRCPRCHRLFHSLGRHSRFCSVSDGGTSSGFPTEPDLHLESDSTSPRARNTSPRERNISPGARNVVSAELALPETLSSSLDDCTSQRSQVRSSISPLISAVSVRKSSVWYDDSVHTFVATATTRDAADKSTPADTTPPLLHSGSVGVATKLSDGHNVQSNRFLPRLRLPKASDDVSWREVDNWIKVNVVPLVLQTPDVNSKFALLHGNLFSFLKRRFGCQSTSSRKRKRANKLKSQSTVDDLRCAKNDLRKKFRQAKRDGVSPDVILHLARQFHQLVRRHSKLKFSQNKQRVKNSAVSANKRFTKNFWRFAKDLFSDDDVSSEDVSPNFSVQVADQFFQNTYSKGSSGPSCPSDVPTLKSPKTQFDIRPISANEVARKIKHSRNSSTPSPLDGISYLVLKKCPSLLPALVDLYNCCWLSCSVPSLWKTGVIRLIPKSGAAADPTTPSNFRPIALTPCIGKIYTSILKDRWCDFLLSNGFLDTSVQKAFLPGVCGTDEHHFKLWSLMEDARRNRRCLSVCWLDFANAYGSVPHWLVRESFVLHHAPLHLQKVVMNLYSSLQLLVSTSEWSTPSIPCHKGVFQGDPFSVIVFNTVINTLVLQLQQSAPSIGYKLQNTEHIVNTLLFADDLTLLARNSKNLQTLCDIVSKWCCWSQLSIKPSKCSSLSLSFKPSYHARDPAVSVSGSSIPFLGEDTFKFLGMPVNGKLSTVSFKESLKAKVRQLMEKVDSCLLSCCRKLKLYSQGVFPRLAWSLSLVPLAPSWVRTDVDSIVTYFLKKWTKLPRSACTVRLYLEKSKGGLGLPCLSHCSSKFQASKSARFLTSSDNTIRYLATKAAVNGFHPERFSSVREGLVSLSDSPGLSGSSLGEKTKNRLDKNFQQHLLETLQSRKVQGATSRIDNSAPDLWSKVVYSLTSEHFSFILNAVSESLPTNANLLLWKKRTNDGCPLCHKRQTLLHVLNNCSVLLKRGCYNTRHDAVLKIIYDTISQNTSTSNYNVFADLACSTVPFPTDIVVTAKRPDVILWNDVVQRIYLVELTVCHESNFDAADERKTARYYDLVQSLSEKRYLVKQFNLLIGSRGFIHNANLNSLCTELRIPARTKENMCLQIIKTVMEESFKIWIKRNSS